MIYNVVTFGETMLRLTPPDQRKFEQTSQLEFHVGGSESNVAVGLARLGLRTAWLSRLTDNILGRYIERSVHGHGVDTRHVIWTPEDRVGLYFVEEGSAPRGTVVTYDRANSAMSRIQPGDLPDQLFQPGQSQWLHLTGITPALSASAAHTTQQAVQRAKQSGWQVSFDFNLRRLLWSPEQALAGCRMIAEAADILFISISDLCAFYGLAADVNIEKAVAVFRENFPHAVLVITWGANGAVGSLPDGTAYHQMAFTADTRGRIGRGDAFVAGFLFQYVQTQALPTALLWGTAAAALKSTLWGDMPLISRQEVEAIISNYQPSIVR